MDIAVVLSWLLGLAVLLPLGSFVLIFLFGNHMGKGGKQASVCATGAILSSCILSMIALVIWLNHHPPVGHGSHGDHGDAAVSTDGETSESDVGTDGETSESSSYHGDDHHGDAHHGDYHGECSFDDNDQLFQLWTVFEDQL